MPNGETDYETMELFTAEAIEMYLNYCHYSDERATLKGLREFVEEMGEFAPTMEIPSLAQH